MASTTPELPAAPGPPTRTTVVLHDPAAAEQPAPGGGLWSPRGSLLSLAVAVLIFAAGAAAVRTTQTFFDRDASSGLGGLWIDPPALVSTEGTAADETPTASEPTESVTEAVSPTPTLTSPPSDRPVASPRPVVDAPSEHEEEHGEDAHILDGAAEPDDDHGGGGEPGHEHGEVETPEVETPEVEAPEVEDEHDDLGSAPEPDDDAHSGSDEGAASGSTDSGTTGGDIAGGSSGSGSTDGEIYDD